MAASSITSFQPPSPMDSPRARSQFGREQGGTQYSSSESNTEDDLDYTDMNFSREEDADDEEKFEEAYDVETEDASTSQAADEEGFFVKAPVTESRYRVRKAEEDVFEDSEDQLEKISEVAREGREDEVDSAVVKNVDGATYTVVRAVGPEIPGLKAGSGGLDRTESNGRRLSGRNESGAKGGSDADEDDVSDEDDHYGRDAPRLRRSGEARCEHVQCDDLRVREEQRRGEGLRALSLHAKP